MTVRAPDLSALPGGAQGLSCLKAKLGRLGLRPTRQRLVLGALLFAAGERHVTAQTLYEEARNAGHTFALATIYNVLNCFTRNGLLRQLAVESGETFFDTNTADHSHFYLVEDGRMIDIPAGLLRIEGLPEPPAGLRVAHVDVIVRLAR